jgi:uncharacterized membrane protein SpoIIM required for sporulation
MSKKIRILFFGIFFGLFLGAYSIGAANKMSAQDSQEFLKEFQDATNGIDGFGIFSHNVSIGLPMFVPGFGIAWGSYNAWSTGVAFNALISQLSQVSNIPPLAILLVSPFGLMELGAYSIAMSRSFLLAWVLIKREPIKKELQNTGIEIGVSIALLVVAAFVEFAMIHPKT